jgi:hypothetical protein
LIDVADDRVRFQRERLADSREKSWSFEVFNIRKGVAGVAG